MENPYGSTPDHRRLCSDYLVVDVRILFSPEISEYKVFEHEFNNNRYKAIDE